MARDLLLPLLLVMISSAFTMELHGGVKNMSEVLPEGKPGVKTGRYYFKEIGEYFCNNVGLCFGENPTTPPPSSTTVKPSPGPAKPEVPPAKPEEPLPSSSVAPASSEARKPEVSSPPPPPPEASTAPPPK